MSGEEIAAADRWPELERIARRAFEALQRDRTCEVALGVAMAIYAAVELRLTRGTTLFADGVDLFVNNRGLDPGALLRPLNGHLVLMERAVYAVGLPLFGASFLVYRLVEIAGALLAVGLLFVLLRRRLGPPTALALSILVLFLGSAWEVMLIPDGMTNVYCAAAGLGAFLALERDDRRGDVAACLLLVAAIACWSWGAAFAVGAGVFIAMRPRPRRRLWIVAVPLLLYAGWLLWVRLHFVPAHGEVQTLAASNVLKLPDFVADEAGAVAGAISGLNWDFASADPIQVFSTNFGFGVAIAAVIGAGIVIAVRRRGGTPFLWGAVATLLAFWISVGLALGVGRSPSTIRYVYPGVILVLVIAAEALRGVRPSPRVLAIVFAATVFALGINLYRLDKGSAFFRDYSASERAKLSAIELASNRVRPDFAATGLFAPIPAEPYLAAVARNGFSPAFSPSELAAQPEGLREIADSTLVGALRIRLVPASPTAGTIGCRRIATVGGAATLAVRPPGVVLTSPVRSSVTVGQFGDAATVSVGTLQAGRPESLRIPPDASGASWKVSVAADGGPVTVCPASG